MSSQLTNYLWFEPYMNAICETDETRKPGRILEAQAALEQRLLSPVRAGGDEDRALQTAQLGLRKLAAERTARIERIGSVSEGEGPLQGVPG